MAVVNVLSTTISNYDAQPRILTSGYIAGANDTVCVASASMSATDSVGSTYRFGFLPSGVRIQDMQIMNTASTTGAFSLGVYCNDQQTCVSVTGGVKTTASPGAVPIANAQLIFGTGISTASAQVGWKSIFAPTILSAAFAATNNTLRVWELLGFDADPFYEFHLVLTATTAPTAAATVAVQYAWMR